MIHDNTIKREDIKTVTKHSIIFTLYKFKIKMPTQRKPSRAVGTENADKSCLYPKENYTEQQNQICDFNHQKTMVFRSTNLLSYFNYLTL